MFIKFYKMFIKISGKLLQTIKFNFSTANDNPKYSLPSRNFGSISSVRPMRL